MIISYRFDSFTKLKVSSCNGFMLYCGLKQKGELSSLLMLCSSLPERTTSNLQTSMHTSLWHKHMGKFCKSTVHTGRQNIKIRYLVNDINCHLRAHKNHIVKIPEQNEVEMRLAILTVTYWFKIICAQHAPLLRTQYLSNRKPYPVQHFLSLFIFGKYDIDFTHGSGISKQTIGV